MTLPARIRVAEVGPRDGLQNEAMIVSVQDKVRLIDLLSQTGVAEIEVSSFVSPKWIPQLGDAAEVFAQIQRKPGVVYSALVPNEQGMARALESRVDKVAIFTAASETFSQRNTNASIAETIERFRPVIRTARRERLPTRAYVSCAIACPFEGPIRPAQVREVVEQLRELEVDEIDLGDTIGVAVPTDLDRLFDELEGVLDPDEATLHLHDTRGTALACVLRGLELGVRSFDASCVGLGGCPYAPGASGNLATEDLVYFCNRMACETGVDLKKLLEAGRHIAGVLGRRMPSRVFNAEAGMGANNV